MGRIGLPPAMQFASKGHAVLGADVNSRMVDLINSGIVPFPGEAELDERMAAEVANGSLVATLDTTAAVADSGAVVVVVPLFVGQEGVPDFGWMDSATESIAKGLKAGTLVSYETTLAVGTTRQRFAPALERASGLARRNGVWNVGSSEASEMATLAEATYRDVNIGFANQFARYPTPNTSTSVP